MSWETGTILVMVFCSTILIGWDVVVAFFNDVPNDQDTESGIFKRLYLSGWWPLVYGWGVLGGHFFLEGLLITKVHSWGLGGLIGVAVALLVLGLRHVKLKRKEAKWRRTVRAFGLLNLGVVMGWLFWSQG